MAPALKRVTTKALSSNVSQRRDMAVSFGLGFGRRPNLFVTLSSLKSFPDQLEEFFEAVPNSYQHWVPDTWEGIPSESFTAIEQICHVRDVEIDGYHVRFRRLLEEEAPILVSLDGYALAKVRRYSEANPAEVFAAIRTARSHTVELIRNLTDTQLYRTGLFEGYGQLTIRGLIHYLCSHDQQHLAGMQWLLGKIDSHAAMRNS